MAVKGLVGIQINGKVYADYNGYDSGPERLGERLCEEITWLNTTGEMKALCRVAEEMTVKRVMECINLPIYQSLRTLIRRGYVVDTRAFSETAECQWIYIVNLDSKRLEMYFQKEPFIAVSFAGISVFEGIHVDHLMDLVADSHLMKDFDHGCFASAPASLRAKVA